MQPTKNRSRNQMVSTGLERQFTRCDYTYNFLSQQMVFPYIAISTLKLNLLLSKHKERLHETFRVLLNFGFDGC